MIELGKQACLAIKPAGERGIVSQRPRQQLQRRQTVQLWLPHFEDRSHPALADQLKHLQMRKCGVNLIKADDLRLRGRRLRRLSGGSHQAARAKPLCRPGRKRRATLRTGRWGGLSIHITVPEPSEDEGYRFTALNSRATSPGTPVPGRG